MLGIVKTTLDAGGTRRVESDMMKEKKKTLVYGRL